MTGFEHIIGHEDIIRHICEAIRQKKVNHAYLLEGDAGSGKKTVAAAFARALECEKEDGSACCECRSCHQADAGTHPDIRVLTHEKPAVITVDEVRTQVIADVAIRPYYGRHKVYIIPEAEKMNIQAQNALLKTLEEPPEYVVILLLTTNAQRMLETIRSRCILMPLRPLPGDVVEKWLMEKKQLPDYQSRLFASFAQGSLGKAAMLAESAEFNELKDMTLSLVRRTGEMNVTDMAGAVKQLAEKKEMAEDFLDILTLWYRDLLYYKASSDAQRLIFKDQQAQIREHANRCTYQQLDNILQAIEAARSQIRANVSFDLCMEMLLVSMRGS